MLEIKLNKSVRWAFWNVKFGNTRVNMGHRPNHFKTNYKVLLIKAIWYRMSTLVKQNGKSRWEFKGGISNTSTKKLYLANALRDNQHIISK